MKTKLAIRFLSVLLAVGFIFTACEKENEDLSEGFSNDIKNFVPDSIIQKMRELGMVINEGKVPPNIEGYYLSSPNVLLSSNVPNESKIGKQFADYQYNFYGQNNENLTISMDLKGLSSSGDIIDESTGDGAFLSGFGNTFTAFLLQDGQVYVGNDSAFYQILEVISGEISDDGIQNFHKAIWMLDDFGDPFDRMIPVNTGRVFYDTDSLANVVFAPKLRSLYLTLKKDCVSFSEVTVD